MSSDVALKKEVRDAVAALSDGPLAESGAQLFRALGYASRKTLRLDGSPEAFLAAVPGGEALTSRPAAVTSLWRRVDFLFQLTNDEIPSLAQGQQDFTFGEGGYHRSTIESFVFLAIELQGDDWTRGALVAITREINRLFPMPAVVLFRHGRRLSLAVIDRRPHKRDASRDVQLDRRVSIVKDIDCGEPHRAQIETLCDIALSQVRSRGRGVPTNFRDLYDAWIEALSAQALNTKFYRELANWYLWAVNEVTFPAALRAMETAKTPEEGKKALERENQIAVIRLLTRLIFVWFIKEKDLVPGALFEPAALRSLLVEDPSGDRDSSLYYKAVLQNLFFATLNTEMSDDRRWRTKAASGGLDGQYLIQSAYRFRYAFRDPDHALAQFKRVPFLNGGLFECLDREVSDADLTRNPTLLNFAAKEGSRLVIRADGFSEHTDNRLVVPNRIFFATGEKVDLNEDYGTKGKSYQADGLIEIFHRYKFTVEENTPFEQEVALDPELLGKVFENLLASYNEETGATARKKSGSFYTPREVVDYMVDEALVVYLESKIAPSHFMAPIQKARTGSLDLGFTNGELGLAEKSAPPFADSPRTFDQRLRELLSPGQDNPCSDEETEALIAAIDSLRALDPACGSGAFPMGLLQKLIHILHRLDPDNARWKAQNRRPYEDRLAIARRIPDPSRRETETAEAEAALAKLDHDFSDANQPDYARKLYLIDKCLFGVDIQPIAVQIAKLRFFISLVVSQKIDPDKDNLNITALPNLETKLVAANSLIPIERPAQADLFRNTAIADKEAHLRDMNERYFSARTMKTKRARRDDIARLRDELSALLTADRGLPEADARKMAAWDPFDQNAYAPFFDPEWMFGLSTGFDLVIGNPPYVRHEAIKDQKPALEKHYGGKDIKGVPLGAYISTADLFVYFIQRGIELLNPGGAFAYITSNKWYRAKYGERLRDWINRNAVLRRIVDFGDAEVFDAVAYPTIIIARRRQEPVQVPPPGDVLRVMNWPEERDKSEVEGFPALVDEIGFELPQNALAASGWQLEPQLKRGLLEHIRAAGVPLGQYVEGKLFRGPVTGLNKIFVINSEIKNHLTAHDVKIEQFIKPFVIGRNVKRWSIKQDDNWLLFIPWHFPLQDQPIKGASSVAEREFARNFPYTYKYLSHNRDELEARNKTETGILYEWYALQRWGAEFYHYFERNKVFIAAIAPIPTAAIDRSHLFPNNKTSVAITDEPEFICTIINSSVSEWFSRITFSTKQGGFFDFEPRYTSTFVIPRASQKEKRLIFALGAALSLERNPVLEYLANGFVYELFFPEQLHIRNLTLFDEAERVHLDKLADLKGEALVAGADEFADKCLVPGTRLRTMLSDLQALDVVRTIEGKA